MSRERFLSTWDRHLADFCAEELMRDGTERALLARLRPYPKAAAVLIDHAARSPDYRHRKAAAILAGSLEDASPDLLDSMFELESERNALASPDTTEPLCCQSVVEDLVLTATLWCRCPATREAGIALLRKVVERTLIGEYWSSAGSALVTLCRYRAPQWEELLRLFGDYVAAPPPDHPLRPTFQAEREFARRLASGAPEVMDAVEVRIGQDGSSGEGVEFDPETEAQIEAWLAEARQLG